MDSFQMPLILDSAIRRSPNLVASEIDSDLVILSIEQGRYYGVQVVGKRIWELLSETTTVVSICDILMDEFDVNRAICEQEVLAFLHQLYQEDLIEIAS